MNQNRLPLVHFLTFFLWDYSGQAGVDLYRWLQCYISNPVDMQMHAHTQMQKYTEKVICNFDIGLSFEMHHNSRRHCLSLHSLNSYTHELL